MLEHKYKCYYCVIVIQVVIFPMWILNKDINLSDFYM